MGLGNSCCLGGSSTDIKFYHGIPSVTKHPYLKKELFSSRMKDFKLDSISRMPRFIYDIDVNIENDESHRIYLACGSDGVFSWDITPGNDERDNDDLVNWKSQKRWLNRRLQADTFASSFNDSYGTMTTGYKSSIRYGFDNFSSSYSVQVYENKYLFIACGTRGLRVVDLESGSVKHLLNNQVTFNNGNNGEQQVVKTIFNKIKIFGDLIYIGTCGYDYPLLDYDSFSLGDFYQVEYGLSSAHKAFTDYNEFYGGESLGAAGLFIYDIKTMFKQAGLENLEEGEIREELNPFVYHADSQMHVNDIQPVAENIYFAVGQREEKTGNEAFYQDQKASGPYHINRDQDGKVYKVRKNHVTGSYETEVYDEGFPFTALDYKDGDLYAATGTHKFVHGIRKNGQNFINTQSVMQASRCFDPALNNACFLVDLPTGNVVTVDGAYGAQIDSYKNPTTRNTNLVMCERFDYPYGTQETIANITTGVHVNSNYIYVSFFNNGFAVFDKGTGALVNHRKSFIDVDCSDFITSDEEEFNFDKNAECTFSCGKIYSSRGRIFIIDSIQYVASGSGPGVYNPSSRSHDVFKYSGLIKSFQQYRGIIEL